MLFFLTPKYETAFVYDDYTLRQTAEKLQYYNCGCAPVINRNGEYTGVITDGDLLRHIRLFCGFNFEKAENTPIYKVRRKKHYEAVEVNETTEALIEKLKYQRFVPVIDGRNSFIGIIRHIDVIEWGYRKYKEKHAER